MSKDLLGKRWQTFIVYSEDDPNHPFEPYMYSRWGGGVEEMAHDFFTCYGRLTYGPPESRAFVRFLPFPDEPLPAPSLFWPIL
jgi:hypothetical protein